MRQDHLVRLAEELLIDQQAIDNFVLPDDSVHIRPASDYTEKLIENIGKPPQGNTLPWPKTHDRVLLRPGEVTIWAGYNGHKKSMLTSYVAHDLALHGQTSCIASLEMAPVVTLKRMAAQAIGTQNYTPEQIRSFIANLKNRLYLYDQQNTVPTERVLRMTGYCGNKLGLDHLYIDSMMKCGMATDDYSAQKQFVNSLCAIAKDTGMHIHLIAHMRKPPKDVSHVPDKYEISGGGDITNQADNVFIVWTDMDKKKEMEKDAIYRDKDKTHDKQGREKWDCLLIVDKQRNGEHEQAFGLYFDNASLKFTERSTRFG